MANENSNNKGSKKLSLSSKSKTIAGISLVALMASASVTVAPAYAQDIVPATSDATGACITSETGIGIGCADFADEFNGTDLNPNIWTEKTGRDKQDPYGRYTKDATEVSDGTLKINTAWGNVDENGNPIADNSGQSAQITTRDKASFEYGVWEAKLWVITNEANQNTANGHTGFYLYGDPTDPTDFRQQIEPDLAESFNSVIPGTGRVSDKALKSFGPEDKVQTVVHYPQTYIDQQIADGVPANQVQKASRSTTSTYAPGTKLTVTAKKDPTGFYIYHNGELINSISSTDPNYASIFPEGVPMGTVLTTRVSNSYWGVQAHANGGLVVDYVRHWALPSGETVETPPVEVTPPAEPTDPSVPEPTEEPTEEPTVEPTEEPTEEPNEEPTPTPTVEPSEEPTPTPTVEPSEEPTVEPSEEPTPQPSEDAEVTPEPSPSETTTEPKPSPSVSESVNPVPEVVTPSPSSPAVEPSQETNVTQPSTSAPSVVKATNSPESAVPSTNQTQSSAPVAGSKTLINGSANIFQKEDGTINYMGIGLIVLGLAGLTGVITAVVRSSKKNKGTANTK